jgi:hypothetical protein
LKDFIVLTDAAASEDDQRILRFGSWMGIAAKRVTTAFTEEIRSEGSTRKPTIAISADVLALLYRVNQDPHALKTMLMTGCEEILVFNCHDSAAHREALSWLSQERIRDVTTQQQQGEFTIPASTGSITRQLAGVPFSVKARTSIATFDLTNSNDSSAEVLMSANDKPMFVRVESRIFLLAGTEIPDIDAPIADQEAVADSYDKYIPLFVFLRHCFGDSCWHGRRRTARLIIDDPLIRRRYGGLDYQALRGLMASKKFGTDIAFIPWNHWRTSSRTAAKLIDETSLAVCVHGCDHTNREFVSSDARELLARAELALKRLESQKRRTGVGYEDVMVFPQGVFSTAAIAALRDAGFLAAVNTTCLPAGTRAIELTTGDLLRPAVTAFHGFPIFQRHYPRRIVDFALDLFLGRPALIVEHHDYFIDGGARFETFLSQLQGVEPDLVWPPLIEQFVETCNIRSTGTSAAIVEFYTRRFRLRNDEPRGLDFGLQKYEPEFDIAQSVSIDGKSVPFTFADGYLKLECRVEANSCANIEVRYRSRSVDRAHSFGWTYNAGVMLRRGLSEFRDTTLKTHPKLLGIAKSVARRMKVTGEN